MPDIAILCKKCESSHLKQPVGEFRFNNIQKRVYIIEREVWLNDLKLQVYHRLCYIYGVGKGVSKVVWNPRNIINKTTYVLWDGWDWSPLPEFVFITKIEKI